MTNWLADPQACAIRMRDQSGTTEGSGCNIMAGRDEILSRSTRVYREVLGAGTRRERTVWSAGNIQVEREGQDPRRSAKGAASLTLVVNTANRGIASPALHPAEAVIASDVLRAAAVNAGGSACGGQTILELLWEELMVVYERLVTGQEAEDDRGLAQGIAYSIAIMQNPYKPNIDAVREQAAEKWENENG